MHRKLHPECYQEVDRRDAYVAKAEQLISRMFAGIASACVMALGIAQPAFAGLKINLIFVDIAPPPGPK
jgi:hypothetical protein